jgi:hypothetical protein
VGLALSGLSAVGIGCHTFRATGITAYLEAGGTLENARPWQRMKARERQSSTIGQVMKSRWMRLNG